jgi:hypothetical protein
MSESVAGHRDDESEAGLELVLHKAVSEGPGLFPPRPRLVTMLLFHRGACFNGDRFRPGTIELSGLRSR